MSNEQQANENSQRRLHLDHFQKPTPIDQLIDDIRGTDVYKFARFLGLEVTEENKPRLIQSLFSSLLTFRKSFFGRNIVMQSCPFCGHLPDPSNYIDSIHPVNRELSRYTACCLESEGGCGAQVFGRTIDELLENWNRRADPVTAKHRSALNVVYEAKLEWNDDFQTFQFPAEMVVQRAASEDGAGGLYALVDLTDSQGIYPPLTTEVPTRRVRRANPATKPD